MSIPPTPYFLLAEASAQLGQRLVFSSFLEGGTHATSILASDGESDYVIRSFPGEPSTVLREVEILGRLHALGDLVPRHICHSVRAGWPFIVTTRVEGGHPDPQLSLRAIAHEMAAALARIHALPGSGLRPAPDGPPSGDSAVARMAREAWGSLDLKDRVLTHSDYWCGNALWSGEKLTGVVDWPGARHAPRGVDVAWCRLDLVLLGDPYSADMFSAEYQQLTGATIPDLSVWDLQAAASAYPRVEEWAPNYIGIGRTELGPELLRRRLEEWSAALISEQADAPRPSGTLR
ncbi:phosphotransferase family protein [Sinomonas humi]|uniref:phosphotransferase family protein n=1 Tax=Sinomonas humi TaxID=1338436 RepID=UPI0006923376|nr:aminoglycoside phosphotransferase family protein [Sinomonas humi]